MVELYKFTGGNILMSLCAEKGVPKILSAAQEGESKDIIFLYFGL